jgi:hypothetical protein
MAAISHVFTIRRAARILGRDQDMLWDLPTSSSPKTECCGFMADGIDVPREIIKDQIDRTG